MAIPWSQSEVGLLRVKGTKKEYIRMCLCMHACMCMFRQRLRTFALSSLALRLKVILEWLLDSTHLAVPHEPGTPAPGSLSPCPDLHYRCLPLPCWLGPHPWGPACMGAGHRVAGLILETAPGGLAELRGAQRQRQYQHGWAPSQWEGSGWLRERAVWSPKGWG